MEVGIRRPYEPTSPLPPLDGQRATILGLGREGVALARYLVRHGATVTVSDLRQADQLDEARRQLADLELRWLLGGHPPEALEADVVYVSPGVPPEIPFLLTARERGVRLSSGTELVLLRSRAPVIGVTGSSGKTTTTSLIGAMLEASGKRAVVGGNIGRTVLDELDTLTPSDRLVLELSSFQLETVALSPHVAVVLNLTPDHLDRHPSFAAYRDAKLGILCHQTAADWAILNGDDPAVREMALHTSAHVAWFSLLGDPGGDGAYLTDGRLALRQGDRAEVICGAGELRLPGRHNLANVLAAAMAARTAGAGLAAIATVARSFAGVPHRLELVAEVDGRRFVNDSIATSPARSMAALLAFEPPIVLLAGGRDKRLPLDEWARLVTERVLHLVVFGEAAPRLAASVEAAIASPKSGQGTDSLPGPTIHHQETLEAAFALAVKLAPRGAVVLLSPACTSFDAYRDYVERGEHFRALVRAWKERAS